VRHHAKEQFNTRCIQGGLGRGSIARGRMRVRWIAIGNHDFSDESRLRMNFLA
jgi:hypothetical protein